MKRFAATARGRVQRVGYREHVYNETFERNISGYVKNLDTGEVEIVAEGSEEDLRGFINEINIIRRPIAVKSFTVRWEEATGEYADFEIVRGDIQEETFEWLGYAGNVLHSMDMKLDQSLQVGKETLQVGKETLQVGKETLQVGKETLQTARETKEEIVGLRSDTRKHLDDEFAEIRKELVSIKDALARAGIQV
ncbi:acylphosphatase [Methanoculleus sp.]|uniref:acylphosphatase n=1 Tax=Methanoculleus sp. TaxID=90427 RepID=UPI0026182E33|nr:acylphosphatase [Methanoculleus sp.]MDI6867754.1 acylphosphatase [Methanoculleus sp.]